MCIGRRGHCRGGRGLRQGMPEGAKEAAEKGLGWEKFEYSLLQRPKLDVDLMGLIGLTKVMPFYGALEVELSASFSATCKAQAFLACFRHDRSRALSKHDCCS